MCSKCGRNRARRFSSPCITSPSGSGRSARPARSRLFCRTFAPVGPRASTESSGSTGQPAQSVRRSRTSSLVTGRAEPRTKKNYFVACGACELDRFLGIFGETQQTLFLFRCPQRQLHQLARAAACEKGRVQAGGDDRLDPHLIVICHGDGVGEVRIMFAAAERTCNENECCRAGEKFSFAATGWPPCGGGSACVAGLKTCQAPTPRAATTTAAQAAAVQCFSRGRLNASKAPANSSAVANRAAGSQAMAR